MKISNKKEHTIVVELSYQDIKESLETLIRDRFKLSTSDDYSFNVFLRGEGVSLKAEVVLSKELD